MIKRAGSRLFFIKAANYLPFTAALGAGIALAILAIDLGEDKQVAGGRCRR